MNAIVILLTAALVGLIAIGVYLEFRPLERSRARRLFKPTVATNIGLFFAAQLGVAVLGVNQALAQPEVAAEVAATGGFSVGMGLVFVGIALPTMFSTVAAAMAVGPIGAASLAAVTEKPEVFGRTLVYLGLAEGIAIYGLVLSILMLNRI